MSPQENLRRVSEDYDNELKFLLSQNVLSNLDAQKIKAQVEVSKNAMLTTKNTSSFSDRAKDKLLNALIRDFEKSIQKTLDDALSRKGDKALLLHRLNRIDNKIKFQATSTGKTNELQSGMDLLKIYILRSVPDISSRWSKSKMDVGKIARDYEKAILEHIQYHFTQPKFLK